MQSNFSILYYLYTILVYVECHFFVKLARLVANFDIKIYIALVVSACIFSVAKVNEDVLIFS